eukprot:Selendium_serpulae@DN5968_c0_g1_i1.p5
MVDTKSQPAETGSSVPINSLTEAQLSELFQNLQSELENLGNILATCRNGKERFDAAAKATGSLNQDTLGKEVFVPLTSSVYVPGRVSDVDHVLVSVGTGYHVKKDVPSAVAFCEKKRDLCNGQILEVTKTMNERKKMLQTVQAVLQGRMSARQQAQPAAPQS